MNQREALVTILDWFAENLPHTEDRVLKRALRVVEKRAEVLRKRMERRRASIPEDIMDEPLTLPAEEIILDLHSTTCRCGAKKESVAGLCMAHYEALDSQLAKALWQTDRTSYMPAYCRALRILGIPTS